MLSAATVEHLVCDICGTVDVGTGAELTDRGWRSHRVIGRLVIFFCLDCRPDLEHPSSEGAATIRDASRPHSDGGSTA